MQGKTQHKQFYAVRQEGKKATILIEGSIGSYKYDADSYESFIANLTNGLRSKLDKLEVDGVEQLTVELNSDGGLLSHALPMYHLLSAFKGEVITSNIGICASAATLFLQAASKGKRRMASHAILLIHKANLNAGVVNENEVKTLLEEFKGINESMTQIYLANTPKKNHKAIRELMEANNGNGKWITAQEALEVGLIDEVFESKTMKGNAKFEFTAGGNLPPIPAHFKASNNTKNMNFFEQLKSFLKDNGLKITNEKGEVKALDTAKLNDSLEVMLKERDKDFAAKFEQINDKMKAFTNSLESYNNQELTELKGQLKDLQEKEQGLSQALAEIKAGEVNPPKTPQTPNSFNAKAAEKEGVVTFHLNLEN